MSSKKTISEEDDRTVHLQSCIIFDERGFGCEAISFVWQYVGSDVLPYNYDLNFDYSFSKKRIFRSQTNNDIQPSLGLLYLLYI